MAEAYRKVERKADEIPDNEIRVKANSRIGRYLRRVAQLFAEEKSEIIIRGVSNAMENVVKLGELIKHRFPNLHQLNKIEEHEFVDEWEPLYEGMEKLRHTRKVTMLSITLSKSAQDTSNFGYQLPIPQSEVKPFEENVVRERKPRAPKEETKKDAAAEDRPRGRGRGRGGRGGRGRGRGNTAAAITEGAGDREVAERGESRRGGRGNRRAARDVKAADDNKEQRNQDNTRRPRGGRGGRGARGGRGGQGSFRGNANKAPQGNKE